MKFDEYVKINNLMFEYDELINNYCRKNQYSEEIINLAVNVADLMIFLTITNMLIILTIYVIVC